MSKKDLKQEVLQALVIADDFKNNLTPLDTIYPSILTPVVNINLFDYLIKTLEQCGVQEVFLYCSNYIDDLKNYITNKNYKNIIVSLVLSEGCRSFGDALRDIDAKGIIRGDFILIRGDAFINANLSLHMDLHKAKREKDKGNAMTLILRNIGSTNQSLLKNESCIVVANKQNKRILFYQKPDLHEKKIKFELEWFLEHEEIVINTGYIDTHVYMCSSAVLPLFADNFDFQTMEDFIKGVLMNEEILDSRIYWQSLKSDEYALPITSWSAYHILSHDILQRQAYPLTPDVLPPLQARGCILENQTIIGKKSILGKNTKIIRSVIGENCIIGDNVKIENSYIFNNIKISNNCIIKNSVLLNNCIVETNGKLDACILSNDVTILNPDSSYDYTIFQYNYQQKIIQSKKMYEKNTSDDDDNDDDNDNDNSNKNFVYFKKKLIDVGVVGDDEDDNNDEPTTDDNDEENYDNDYEDDDEDDDSRLNSPVPDDTDVFLSEVIDSLLRGYQDKLNCDNLILEINSSRYAYNVSVREVSYNVVKAILMLPFHYLNDNKTQINNVNYQKVLMVMINYFHAILLNYIKSDDAQDDCLKAFEEVAASTNELLTITRNILHIFYDKDILSEDKIIDWYKLDANTDENDQDIHQKIRLAAQPFITWLQEAEEDSSSESDDD
ncbi:hypothetical protein HCN44_002895 [Aphidius gifuensis]|uniref:Translation initiation factor eIF2B subunit epsilon n=1 Tax=Aphidius gifuensis TaxID=684658 RepID=A0A834XQ27_APHGI|nr:hypothetical protein HCN44_002895 [Aphidius gifuensis]